MTDVNVATETTTITAAESRDQLIEIITTIRTDALALPTAQEAVDFAIHGTVAAIETGLEVAGQSKDVVVDLSKTLAANWAETVNS